MVAQDMGILFAHSDAPHQDIFSGKALVTSHSTGNQEHMLSLNQPCFYQTATFKFASSDAYTFSEVFDLIFSTQSISILSVSCFPDTITVRTA